VLYSFGDFADGEEPLGVIDVAGMLFGTTGAGGCCGEGGCGVAFSLDPRTSQETVLHSFDNGADGCYPDSRLVVLNGVFYGVTYGGGTGCGGQGCGTVLSLDPSTGAEAILYSFCSQESCTDGETPEAGLIEVKGTLYGTTLSGGTGCDGAGCGTVFSLDPNTGAETVLYAFQGGTDGSGPNAVIDVKGTLYGTTVGGGAYGYGTLFALEKAR
jgi:uncharacterized repeat protein (TIGR03803 family)